MKILAYCTELAGDAVTKAVGDGLVLTSPPLTATDIGPKSFEGYDLIYFRLHSGPGSTVWFGDDGKVRAIAFTPTCIAGARLDGAVVILANCHGENNPLIEIFYQLGAKAVIAGAGKNYAGGKRVIGTDLLTAWIIKGLKAGMSIERAMRLAKARLVFTAWRGPDRDALEFKIMETQK